MKPLEVGVGSNVCPLERDVTTGHSKLDDETLIRLIVQARAEALSEVCDRYGTEPGTYPSYCIPHGGPGMSATIMVQP